MPLIRTNIWKAATLQALHSRRQVRKYRCLTQLVTTENNPSDSDAATTPWFMLGQLQQHATSHYRVIFTRLLWFQCCESYWHKGRGINFSKRSENLNERRTFKRDAYGTCGPVNWKDKNKDQTSLQWHIATWWQEMKIKAMRGNSCTRSSFHYGSFLWCVCSLIFKSLAGSQK